MDIKLFDYQAENALIKESFFDKLSQLYDAGNFTLGFSNGPVEELESLWKIFCNRKHALAVGSGTHALHMAAFALQLKPGDEVIVPANTFIATALAAAYMGATVVQCDIDPHSLNISEKTVAEAMSKNTKAIFAVNLYGNPAPYNEIRKFNVPIIEDAAHSHGAIYHQLPSGHLGTYSALSFFPTKVVGGIGDSGMILFDSDEQEPFLRAFRNGGQNKAHHASVLGNVYRMHVIQAQFLVEKWKLFAKVLEHKRKIAAIYDHYFVGNSKIKTQSVESNCKSSYFAYVVRVKNRTQVMANLKDAGIPTAIQYRYLLQEQEVTQKFNFKAGLVPNATLASQEIVSLPIHLGMDESKTEYVAEQLLKAVQLNYARGE